MRGPARIFWANLTPSSPKEILKSKAQTFAVTKLYGFDPDSLVAATVRALPGRSSGLSVP